MKKSRMKASDNIVPSLTPRKGNEETSVREYFMVANNGKGVGSRKTDKLGSSGGGTTQRVYCGRTKQGQEN